MRGHFGNLWFPSTYQVRGSGPTFHSLTLLIDVDSQSVATKAQQVVNLRLDSSDWHAYLDCCLTSQLLLLLPLQSTYRDRKLSITAG